MKLRLPPSPLLAALTLVAIASVFAPAVSAGSPRCKAWLVQSIPTDMPLLRRVSGVLSTADVLRWLAGNSTKKLDIIAQYWQLNAGPDDPSSGDYGYSQSDMLRFGADLGRGVYKAIKDAADRDVTIRFLQHSGVYPDYDREPNDLASGRTNVKSVTLLFAKWWGLGMVHAKVWISDNRDVYIGSANNDWKSLSQVKELGIYLVNCPKIAKKVETYNDNLWKLSSLNASAYTKNVSDQEWQLTRKVPCWSHFLESKERCKSPLPRSVEVPHVAGYPVLSHPHMFRLPLDTPRRNHTSSQSQLSYLSFAPPELLFGKYQADEQA
ncbi:hypothetical protein BT93_H2671 [Corymbia citriodora subsp. variegata]|nr:hypothetical protein BT93_H2671 [Corymbia citriodora subsp. variegata]